MARADLFETIDYLKREGESLLARFSRANRGVAYADLRFEVGMNRAAAAVNGEPRDSSESQSAAYAVSVHVAGASAVVGHGQTGAELGALATNRSKLIAELRRGLAEAYDRARFSAREKAQLIKNLGDAAKGLAMPPLAPREPVRDEIEAIYARDPRT